MRDGIPWIRVPAWQNPHRPWQKNQTHDQHRIADHTYRTLHQQEMLLWDTPQPQQGPCPWSDPDQPAGYDPWQNARRTP
jgi:hypothetical protein